MTHQKEKHHLVLEKYFVFEWEFAKIVIIMPLLKFLHRKGRAGCVEFNCRNNVAETLIFKEVYNVKSCCIY